MVTALEDEHSFCLLVSSSVHPEHWGRCEESAVLRLCFKKLGHLGSISPEALLQRRAVFISKRIKNSQYSTEDHTDLKQIPEFKLSVSRLCEKVNVSTLFWWTVRIPYVLCEMLPGVPLWEPQNGYKEGPSQKTMSAERLSEGEKREGAYSIQLVSQWPYSSPT